MREVVVLFLFIACALKSYPQRNTTLTADQWVDSVFKTLSEDQKIAQLMIVRLSSIDPSTRKIVFYDQQVEQEIRNYDIGGICLFQGGPLTQASLINHFQQITKTPLLISIDAENGLGMRMDSVMPLPRQMMLGAVQDPDLIYQYGRLVARQCKRMGIQVNYAPVADINNNPSNPVINDRSFGEDKNKVAEYAVQYMKGLQDEGILACAKHFPGHGDVSVDSHVDLPQINKTYKQLDTLELYPFKVLFSNGVGSVMMGHLYVPAIDPTPNRPTSISRQAVGKLLRKKLKFNGLSFTDALEMQGVAKYYPGAEASVESLIAGNDMLCLPTDIPASIDKIKEAIHAKKLKWKDLDKRVKRVLMAKYQAGLAFWQPVVLDHLTDDLNEDVSDMYKRVAEDAITLLKNENPRALPLYVNQKKKIAYVGIGLTSDNAFAARMRKDYGGHVYYFDYSLDSSKALALAELLKDRYDNIIIGVHNYNRFPVNQFGVSQTALQFIRLLQRSGNTTTLVFGNPYLISHLQESPVLAACYDDNSTTQEVAADWVEGKFTAKGRLPVSISASMPRGYGIQLAPMILPTASPASQGMDGHKLLAIDSICKEAIIRQATPGCVVLVARNGKIVYEKAFGYLTYDRTERVYPETIYDLASVTKICATTMAAMKLYDEGRLDLHKTLGDYLPWVRGTNKADLRIWDVMLHQAGLKPDIPFYKETITLPKDGGSPLPGFYEARPDTFYRVRVAENLFMRHDWTDTMYKRIVQSDLGPRPRYVYSDNDFIFMGKVVEAITGKTLDRYVRETFYEPLGMSTAGFLPRENFPLDRIAPTENEPIFRKQLLRGDVHDPGAAMFGGVSGHAGLFADARDLAVLEQMLLNGGTILGQQFLKKETISYFTAYHSDSSRRGLGFDKPEKDNPVRKEPYPCESASSETFGHTGFTGTCVWVDPKYNLVFVFLSNRVNPIGDNPRLSSLSVRGNVMEVVYKAMGVETHTAPVTR